MARILKWGTPNRTKQYVPPGATGRRVFRLSLAAGGALAAGVLLLTFVGLRDLASPGPLASGHAPLDSRCESCHSRGSAVDLRCERCHDPAGTDGWTVPAHSRFSAMVATQPPMTQAAHKAMEKNELLCADCHDDHRGRGFKLTNVSDLTCARCHRADTPSMARHVEFGLIRSKATPPRGLKISHDRHILEALAKLLKKPGLKKKDLKELMDDKDVPAADKQLVMQPAILQKSCETCHVSTADLKGFEPIDFDRHCADCHQKDGAVGATDPVPQADVVMADKIPTSWAAGAAQQFTTRRDKIAKTAVQHRDPWVLFNLAKIRREIEPASYLADRNALLSQIDAARRTGQSFALARAGAAELDARRKAVDEEIAALEKRIASGSASPDPKTFAAGVKSFGAAASAAGAAGVLDAGSASAEPFEKLAARAGAEALAALPETDAAARRAELFAVLDTLRYRAATTGDVLLGRRVDEVARRLTDWKPGKSGLDDLKLRLTERRRERSRLDDEAEYRRQRKDEIVPPVSRVKDRQVLEARARVARQRLVALAAVDGVPVAPIDEAQRASRLQTADSLTTACQKCHERKDAMLAALAIDMPVLPQSIFDHRPHVRLKPCAFCHAEGNQGVLVSKKATDILVPGVANCRTCHRPSEARADCATCHRYHPSGYPNRNELRQPSTALVASVESLVSPEVHP